MQAENESDDDNENDDDEKVDDDRPKLSKKKMKKLNRLSVAELKQVSNAQFVQYLLCLVSNL